MFNAMRVGRRRLCMLHIIEEWEKVLWLLEHHQYYSLSVHKAKPTVNTCEVGEAKISRL